MPKTPPVGSWGERLRLYRKGADLSQVQLADLAGLRQTTISKIETGAITPSVGTRHLLAATLGQPVAVLFPPHMGEQK